MHACSSFMPASGRACRRALAIALLSMACFAVNARSQNIFGSIVGTVSDSAGAVLAGTREPYGEHGHVHRGRVVRESRWTGDEPPISSGSEGQVEFALLGVAERRPVAAREMSETTSVFDDAESRTQPGVDPSR